MGLRALLAAQPDLLLIGEAADAPAAIRLAAELVPDVVVTEVALPGPGGADAVARLTGVSPGQKVLALTACEDPAALRRLVAAGACGYVLKRSPADAVVGAIRAVAGGTVYLDPAVGGAPVPGAHAGGAADLSVREVEVVRQIALGYSNKEIAERMEVSVKTVETYKTRALKKLDLRTRVDVVRYAARRGWLDDADEADGPSATPASPGTFVLPARW